MEKYICSTQMSETSAVAYKEKCREPVGCRTRKVSGTSGLAYKKSVRNQWAGVQKKCPKQVGLRKKKRSGVSETLTRRLDDSQSTFNASISDELQNLSPPWLSHMSNGVPSTPQPPRENLVAADTAQDLDATLGSLKISTTPKANTGNQPSTPFSPRLLFSEKPDYNPKLSGSYCIQKNLVSSSRFSTKNITQSSWVAGGYWGHPVSPARDVSFHHTVSPFSQIPSSNPSYPLSRSSSQSSGFVSQGSGPTTYRTQGPCSLPNSQHGSHCGDLTMAQCCQSLPTSLGKQSHHYIHQILSPSVTILCTMSSQRVMLSHCTATALLIQTVL